MSKFVTCMVAGLLAVTLSGSDALAGSGKKHSHHHHHRHHHRHHRHHHRHHHFRVFLGRHYSPWVRSYYPSIAGGCGIQTVAPWVVVPVVEQVGVGQTFQVFPVLPGQGPYFSSGYYWPGPQRTYASASGCVLVYPRRR